MEFDLGRDEFFFLLSLFRPTAILAVGNPYTGLSREDTEICMARARESLGKQRHITVTGDGGVVVERILAGLVATCAFPDVSLIATHTDGQGLQDVRFAHFTSHLIAEDAVLPSGDHRLTGLLPSAVTERIVTQFQLNGQLAAPGEPCVLGQDTLEAAWGIACASGPPAAAMRLRGAGLSAENAVLLGEALAAPLSNSALAIARLSERQPGRSLGFLRASSGLWLLRVVDEAQIEISPCGGAEAAREVAELVSEAQALLP